MKREQPCCARLTGRITRAKAELASLARREASDHARGRNVSKYVNLIAKAKAELARAHGAMEDHEAEHAA